MLYCIGTKRYNTFFLCLFNHLKSFIILAVACNEFAAFISASLRPGKTAFFQMLQRWRTVGNTVSDLTGPGFDPDLSSHSLDKHVTARPTFLRNLNYYQFSNLRVIAPQNSKTILASKPNYITLRQVKCFKGAFDFSKIYF